MISLRRALPKEAHHFVAMEQSGNTSEYIIPYTFQHHQAEMKKPDIIYLSITEGDSLSGFIILAVDANSVELRRIVVASKEKGIGQAAITKMERFCLAELDCNRVWLDVFAFNERGRHIYEKLGYKHFKSGSYNGKSLLFYEKTLQRTETKQREE